MDANIDDWAPAVAIPFTRNVDIDAVLAEVVVTLRHEGGRVGGLLLNFLK